MKRFRRFSDYLSKGNIFLLLIVFIFGLTPLVWFWNKWDQVINGIDTNFPLNPLMWFGQRFFVWSEVFNGGRDVSSSTAGIFFHGLQAFFHSLNLTLTQTQLLTLIFWFSFLGLSILFFLRTVLGKTNTLALISAVSFYLFNTYLFNTWENVKVANLALVGGLPIILALFWKCIEGKSISFQNVAFVALFGFIIAGSGINPAYFVVLVGVPLLLFFLIFIWKLLHERREIIHLLISSFLFFAALILVNLFWILPTAFSLLGFGQVIKSLEQIGFINWVGSLSQNSSVLNIMKLQGAWDWYSFDDKGVPSYIPYSPFYLGNKLAIIFAMTLPLLAIFGLFFARKKYKVLSLLCSFILVVGIFLGAGTHLPTGYFYIWVSRHVPFFSFFRSPWYIFTPLMLISIATLIAIFFQGILDFLEKNRGRTLANLIFSILSVSFIVINTFYNWPLVRGDIFRPNTDQNFLLKVPDYVFESKNFLDTQKTNNRILDYPARETENFTWGYRGIESVLKLITDRPIVYFKDFYPGVIATGNVLRANIYDSLTRGNVEEGLKLARVFGVDTILEKKDLAPVTVWKQDRFLDSSIGEKQQFGQWSFYSLPKDLVTPRIFASGFINKIWGAQSTVGIAFLAQPDKRAIFINSNDFPNQPLEVADRLIIEPRNSYFENFNTFIEVVEGTTDEELRIRERYFRQPQFPTNEVLYYFELERDGKFVTKISRDHLLHYGLEEKGEWTVFIDDKEVKLAIERVEGRWLTFREINLLKGKHQLKLPLPKNPNLVEDGSFEGPLSSTPYFKKVLGDSADGLASTELRAWDDDREIVIPVNQFDPYSLYLVSIDYKHLFGYRPTMKLFQKVGREFVYQQTEHVSFSRNWQIFRGIFKPEKIPTSSFEIHLIAFANVEEGTGTRWDNLQVTRIFNNSLLLQEIESNTMPADPEIVFRKQNPTRWIVEVKNADKPFILSFLENYSWGWKVYESSNPDNIFSNLIFKPIPEDMHLIVQGYANGWVIDKTGNYYLVIEYLPQRIFYIALLVSSIVLLSSMVVLLIAATRILKMYVQRKP